MFLFFGLFANPDTGEHHHRIFGYCKVRTATPVDALSAGERAELVALQQTAPWARVMPIALSCEPLQQIRVDLAINA